MRYILKTTKEPIKNVMKGCLIRSLFFVYYYTLAVTTFLKWSCCRIQGCVLQSDWEF